MRRFLIPNGIKTPDGGRGELIVGIPEVKRGDKAEWKCHWRLEKREGDIDACPDPESRKAFLRDVKPYEVIEGEGNCLLTTGIATLWDLFTGAGGTAFDNTNACIGVGNDTSDATATFEGLAGGSQSFKAMDTGYPTSTDAQVVFKSSFASTWANFDWAEWTVANSTDTGSNININRKAENLGTKATGTWSLEVSITLS
jgi:hypothetical protein